MTLCLTPRRTDIPRSSHRHSADSLFNSAQGSSATNDDIFASSLLRDATEKWAQEMTLLRSRRESFPAGRLRAELAREAAIPLA